MSATSWESDLFQHNFQNFAEHYYQLQEGTMIVVAFKQMAQDLNLQW